MVEGAAGGAVGQGGEALELVVALVHLVGPVVEEKAGQQGRRRNRGVVGAGELGVG